MKINLMDLFGNYRIAAKRRDAPTYVSRLIRNFRRGLTAFLLSLIFIFSGCSSDPSKNAEALPESIPAADVSVEGVSVQQKTARETVQAWAELSGYALPEANESDVYVSFDFAAHKLTARYIINFGKEIDRFDFSVYFKAKIDEAVIAEAVSGAELVSHRNSKPTFGEVVRMYSLEFETPASIAVVEYTTDVNGWLNIIEENRVAVSSYSSWAITETSEPVDFNFHLEGLEDYLVLKSDYDPDKKLWTYRDGYDFGNIIAYKDGIHYNNVAFNVYAPGGSGLEEAGAECVKRYDEIISFYKTVFPEKEISAMDLAVLGMSLPPNQGGAYFRKELIVLSGSLSMESGELGIWREGLLSHEIAHNWFTGADSNTWEDWLNETGAEWASMLYLREAFGEEYFEEIVDFYMNFTKNNGAEAIKTPDGSHPGDAHYMGTYLFSELYRSRGLDAVTQTLVTLSEVLMEDEPATEKFIAALRVKMGGDIPDRIERGLELTDYTGLFE